MVTNAHAKQGLLTTPEHMRLSVFFNGAHFAGSLVFCILFCSSLFVNFFLFAIVMSALIRFPVSDYPFGIFNFFLK